MRYAITRQRPALVHNLINLINLIASKNHPNTEDSYAAAQEKQAAPVPAARRLCKQLQPEASKPTPRADGAKDSGPVMSPRNRNEREEETEARRL
jgi:hypothetical protein